MISPIYNAVALEFINTPEALSQMADFVGRGVLHHREDADVLIIDNLEFHEGDYVVKLIGSIVKVEREAVLSEKRFLTMQSTIRKRSGKEPKKKMRF